MDSGTDRAAAINTSRRNLMRMGALVSSVLITKATAARAEEERWEHGFNRDRDDRNRDRNHDDKRDKHCFLKGTTICTEGGDTKVEDLRVGDVLPTVFGGMCPIQWIGSYHFKRTDPTKGWVRSVLPVRIARSALDTNVPRTDLFVTEQHALLIDGVLVAAGNLINGTTITRYDARDLNDLEFFHIKLERHDAIYAEGAPCETLLQVDENAANFAEYFRRYGPATTEATPCAPLFPYRYRKGEIKSCFRSAASPWIDRRQTADIIRDKLDLRGITILRALEPIS